MNSDPEDDGYSYSEEEEEEEIEEKHFETKEVEEYQYKDVGLITEPNIKCGSCKKKFLLNKKQSIIRCVNCGCRILYKLRTKNSIYYTTD